MSAGTRHETRDIDLRAVLVAGAGLLGLTVAAVVVVWLLFGQLARRAATGAAPQYPLAAGQEQRLPPAPRLQTDPRGDLQRLRETEDRLLQTYGWMDKSAGVVRIPIDRAMQLTLERGLPARPEGAPKP
jgi:hypothetical protein